MRFSNLAVVALSFPFCTRVNSQENEQVTEDTPMAAMGGLLYSIEDSIYHPTIDFDAIDSISFDSDLDGPPLDLKVEYESSFANELKNPPKEKNADDLAGSEIDSSMDLRIDIGRLRQLEPECPSRPVVNETGSLSAEDFHSLISHCYGENPGIDCPEKYDVGLKCWDTSRIMTMNGAFHDLNFNDDISHWDTSNVRDMNSAFRYCWNFNQNLNAWDTGNVEDMYKMFFNAHYFSSNLSRWDTGKVTTMEKMFDGAAYFDSDLSSWNTRNVKNMKRMFLDAYNFNSDVSGWNTGKVTDMTWMFVNAHSFNQCLGSWAVSTPDDVVTKNMFMGSGCPLRDSDPTKGPWCQGFDDRCFGSCLDAEEFRFTIPSGKKKNCGFINKAKKARKFCKKPAFPDEVGQENVFIRHVCMKSCGTFGFGPGRKCVRNYYYS